MQVIYHGHSFIEILTPHGSIMIDPFISGNKLCDIKSIELLAHKNITAILVTHGHHDHVGDTVNLVIQHPHAIIITTNGVAKWLKSQGVSNTIHGLHPGSTFDSDGFDVQLTLALHDGSIMDSGYSSPPCGMIVTIEGKKIYHAGDTGLTQELKLIKEQRGLIDVAFLPIGGHYTMGVEDAVTVCGWISPTSVVPIHYNTFPEIKSDPMEFARLVMLHKYAVPKVLVTGQYVVL